MASDLPVSAASGGSVEALPFSQFALTGDRGVYRITGLPPGNYRVSVRVRESFFGSRLGGPEKVTIVPQRTGLAELTVFAPEALAPSDSKPIGVADGEEVSHIDIAIPTRLLHSLAGTVFRGGEPVGGANLSLEIDGNLVMQYSDALSMPNGSFQFDLLPDGNYSVIAKTYVSEKATSSTTTQVQLLGSDVTDLVVNLPTGAGKQ